MPQAHLKRVVILAAGALLVSGCDRGGDDPVGPAPFPDENVVFDDTFGEGIDFQAFAGSKTDAVQIDTSDRYEGEASLRIAVPTPDDPSGNYAGGAFVASVGRDLTGYNALTFYAKATTPMSLDVAGIGNDNTGTSLYTAQTGGLAVGTSWARYVVPFPASDVLAQEQGLFFFAEGAEEGQANTIWFDEVQFEAVTGLGSAQPFMDELDLNLEVGATASVSGTGVIIPVSGADVRVSAAPSYFDFTSSNTDVATVSALGEISVVGDGTATVSASLGSATASESVTVTTVAGPSAAAPTPTEAAADVISLFSDAYDDVTVDTWSADWDDATVDDVTIAGDAAKKYSGLVFAGIEFTSAPIDASSMTHFRMDIWTPDETADPASLRIKLVDFGADGAYDGGDDAEHEITLTAATTPALATGEWVTLDIPLSAFTGLTTRGSLAQMIIAGDPNTVWVDNVYFYAGELPGPTTAAPTPTRDAASVVSMFSDAYDDVTVDTWSAVWDDATLEDVEIEGNAAKKYSNLVFAGIEATSAPIDASEMTHMHLDLWTPDATTAPAAFRIKLVDFGADGSYDGGDDVEHEISLSSNTTPALATGSWVSLDIPLADFTGLTTTGSIAQMILSGDPNTVWIDNLYFYAAAPSEPTTAAPAPPHSAADVISLFSDEYDDVTVDTWSASWDDAGLADIEIEGNATKKYTNLVFAGIEFTSAPIDASGMTHFSLDVWTPDATAAPAAFRIKLVDFGADGAFGGGDDVEHELTLNAETTPALASGAWSRLDIPLADFANLTTRGAVAQLIISGDPNTVFIDNVLFHGR
jgi:hypothetical protein